MDISRDHIKLLGWKVTDRVTGFKGIVESISFDLYGCLQAVVRPAVNEKNEVLDGRWFDVNRLVVDGDGPVMPMPEFRLTTRHKDVTGPADKPIPDRSR